MGKHRIKQQVKIYFCKKNIAGCCQNRMKLEKMAKYSIWADIAETVVNDLNWQKCVKCKNYQLKTKKGQGRN